jgi:hypothetical protein
MAHSLVSAVAEVSVSELVPHPQNPRRGSVDLIKESLEANGQYKPLVVQRSTGHVLAGNHTLTAAEALGWETISVVYVDVDDPAALKILLADNRTSDKARYDDDTLLEALAALEGDFTGTGYTIDDHDDLTYLLQGIAEVAVPITDAHYNESEEELAARTERFSGHESLASRGVAEMVLVVKGEQKEQMFAWFQDLRGRWGDELSNGDLVYEAVRRAVQA